MTQSSEGSLPLPNRQRVQTADLMGAGFVCQTYIVKYQVNAFFSCPAANCRIWMLLQSTRQRWPDAVQCLCTFCWIFVNILYFSWNRVDCFLCGSYEEMLIWILLPSWFRWRIIWTPFLCVCHEHIQGQPRTLSFSNLCLDKSIFNENSDRFEFVDLEYPKHKK